MKKHFAEILFVAALLGSATLYATITGVTGNFGSGNEVVLDSNGITVTSGTLGQHRYKFDNGSYMGAPLGALTWVASAGGFMNLDNRGLYTSGSNSLGVNGTPWVDIYVAIPGSSGNYVCYDPSDSHFYRNTSCP